MGRSCTELARHVLPGYLIDQPQIDDCTLHVAQRRHAAQSQRILLGHRNDVPSLMRQSDVLVLPSIEEGSALVITEAMGSGCVPLASDASADPRSHLKTGLVHPVRDVEALARHITMLNEDRALLERLRAACLEAAPRFTWTAAGPILLDAYHKTIAAHQSGLPRETGRSEEARVRG